MNKHVQHYINLVDNGLNIRGAFSLASRMIALTGNFDDFLQLSELHEEDCKREFDLMLQDAEKVTAGTVTKKKVDTL